MIKAVLFDLDDTLTRSKEKIDFETIGPLVDLISKTHVAIVSGASFKQQLDQVIYFLPSDTHFENLYSFPENAAECQKWNGSKWEAEYSFKLNDEEVKEIMDAFDVVLKETCLVDNEPSYGDRIENRGSQVTFSALGQKAPIELKSVWDVDHKKREQIVSKLAPMLTNFDIKIGGGTSIDVTKKGVNKTNAIKWLSDNLSIPVSDMVYVGDSLFQGGNDAIVIQTGIPTIETKNPEQTVEIIKNLISKTSL